MQSLMFFDIFKDMAAKVAEVFEALDVFIYAARVDIEIFVDEKISQICHRGDLLSEIVRNNMVVSHGQYRLSVIIWPRQIVIGNNIVGDIKEALYG